MEPKTVTANAKESKESRRIEVEFHLKVLEVSLHGRRLVEYIERCSPRRLSSTRCWHFEFLLNNERMPCCCQRAPPWGVVGVGFNSSAGELLLFE